MTCSIQPLQWRSLPHASTSVKSQKKTSQPSTPSNPTQKSQDGRKFVQKLKPLSQNNRVLTVSSKQGPNKSLQRSTEQLDDLLVLVNSSSPSQPTLILAITILPFSELIGTIGTFRPREIGFSLLPKYWGKGFASEACKEFCKRYLEIYPGQQLFAKVNRENEGSVRCLRRCGFTPASVEEEGSDALLGVDRGRETWLLRGL